MTDQEFNPLLVVRWNHNFIILDSKRNERVSGFTIMFLHKLLDRAFFSDGFFLFLRVNHKSS